MGCGARGPAPLMRVGLGTQTSKQLKPICYARCHMHMRRQASRAGAPFAQLMKAVHESGCRRGKQTRFLCIIICISPGFAHLIRRSVHERDVDCTSIPRPGCRDTIVVCTDTLSGLGSSCSTWPDAGGQPQRPTVQHRSAGWCVSNVWFQRAAALH